MINREAIGRRLIHFAWGVEIVAASIGLTIALLVILATRRTLEQSGAEISAAGYMDMFLGGLPFIVVAMVELTKIPLATACYTAINRAWKTAFGVALIVLSIITFETILNGFERNFTQRTFVLASLKKQVLNIEEKIAKTDTDVQQMSEASESKLRESYNADIEQTEKEKQSELDVIEKERADARVRFGGDEAKFINERLQTVERDLADLEKRRATELAKIEDRYSTQMARIGDSVNERRASFEAQIRQIETVIADSRRREEQQLAGVRDSGDTSDALTMELTRIQSDFAGRIKTAREELEQQRRNLDKGKSDLAELIGTTQAERDKKVDDASIFSVDRVRAEFDERLGRLHERQRQLDEQSVELSADRRMSELDVEKDRQISDARARSTEQATRGERGRETVREKFATERQQSEQQLQALRRSISVLSTSSQIDLATSKRDTDLSSLSKDIDGRRSELRTQQAKHRNDLSNVASNSRHNLQPVLNRLDERRAIVIQQIDRRQETRRKRYEVDLARLVQRDETVRRLQASLATMRADRLKRREEIVRQAQNSQIYRIAALAYGRDSPADITNDELRVVTIIWFGSLAAITAWTGTILAFGGLVVRYGPHERLPKRPGRVMWAARAFLVDRRRQIRKPIIREIEKEVVKVVEVVKEVPVDKVVFKEVVKEVVHRELVYVPMFTDDPDLLRESVVRKNGAGESGDGHDGGGEDETDTSKPSA